MTKFVIHAERKEWDGKWWEIVFYNDETNKIERVDVQEDIIEK